MILSGNEFISKYGKASKLCESTFAKMYINEGTLIKKYRAEADYYSRLDLDVFNKLCELDSPCFINLKDCYTSTVTMPRDGKEKEVINAYTSDFIRKKITKTIDMPMEYTLETLYEFKKIVEFLNNNSIVIVDECAKNCIVSKNGIVIVDPDFFKLDSLAYKFNLSHINTYIIDLWCNEYGIYDLGGYRDLEKLFYKKSTEDYYEVMKERLDEKTPREVIKKHLKKCIVNDKSTYK